MALAAVIRRGALADQAASFEIAQHAAEVTGIEIETARNLTRGRRMIDCNLVEDARFAERVRAVEKRLPQHPDLSGVIAVEAAHRGDLLLSVLDGCHGCHGQLVD